MKAIADTLLIFLKLTSVVILIFTIGAVFMQRAATDQNEIGVKNGN